MIEVFSAAWCDEAMRRLNALTTQASHPGARIQLHVDAADGARPLALVLRDGAIARWEPGVLAEFDIELCWNLRDAWRIWTAGVDGTEAAVRTTVGEPGTGHRGPLPPLDRASRSGLPRLPRVPHAHLAVQWQFGGGPFGPIECFTAFVDGQIAHEGPGRLDDPDVLIASPFDAYAALCCGEATSLDTLHRSRLALREHRGLYERVMLAGGLLDSPEFLESLRASRVPAAALAALARVTGSDAARAALSRLSLETRPIEADGP